ncbi:hypothetical protein ACFVWY_21535 [Streptomyces sp. NPDC058195]|uniref:hypothetical protein n=1 Tax=Streptomyces sp. NPDC058195 TaxID=3346375 RepID=UPI0036E23E86
MWVRSPPPPEAVGRPCARRALGPGREDGATALDEVAAPAPRPDGTPARTAFVTAFVTARARP